MRTTTTKSQAIEIIIGMKRYYAQKKDKYLIDMEIERLVKAHGITYGDVINYQEKINEGIVIPYWKHGIK